MICPKCGSHEVYDYYPDPDESYNIRKVDPNAPIRVEHYCEVCGWRSGNEDNHREEIEYFSWARYHERP